MHPLRTRFAKDIVTEFLPPRRRGTANRRRGKGDNVIIFCDGQPSVPSKRSLLEFFSRKGWWAFHPRYRGTWESGGRFLARSPHEDVLDVVRGLSRPFRSFGIFGGKRFRIRPKKIVVCGGSFGGPAAILASRDRHVTKAIALTPVVDWKDVEKTERSSSVWAYTRAAFGNGYRGSRRDWDKLKSGKFYNPTNHAKEIDGSKLLILHARDDDVVRWRPVAKFAKATGGSLVLLARGGHFSSSLIMTPRIWKRVRAFIAGRRASA